MILPKPSTLAFLREARQLPRFSWFDKLHAYLYLRWPYFYIGVAVGEHPLAHRLERLTRWFERRTAATKTPNRSNGESKGVSFSDTYHGKVVPLEAATRLVTVNRTVELKNLEHVIPYALARDIVLKNPDHIALLAVRADAQGGEQVWAALDLVEHDEPAQRPVATAHREALRARIGEFVQRTDDAIVPSGLWLHGNPV